MLLGREMVGAIAKCRSVQLEHGQVRDVSDLQRATAQSENEKVDGNLDGARGPPHATAMPPIDERFSQQLKTCRRTQEIVAICDRCPDQTGTGITKTHARLAEQVQRLMGRERRGDNRGAQVGELEVRARWRRNDPAAPGANEAGAPLFRILCSYRVKVNCAT